jgi:C4-dicarboxylate-binding protein DctP
MSANKPLHGWPGQKMRIQSSKVLDAQDAEGRCARRDPAGDGVQRALPGAEVGCGRMDTEGVPSNFYTQKIYEVQ